MTTRRDGTTVFYALRGTKVLQAVDLLREFLAQDLADYGRLSEEMTS